MGEPWLRMGGRWMSSPQVEEVYDLYVNQLMVEGERRWDEQQINSLFSEEEAHNIISMPLFQTVQHDKLIWDGNKDRVYEVREGYRLLMKERWKHKEGAVTKNWRGVWAVNAPPKARHAMWRVCSECIPTRVRLVQRNVECNTCCPLCNEGLEDDYHAFALCPDVVASWEAAGLSNILIRRLPKFNNVSDLLFDICSGEDQNIAGRVAALLWSVWQNRNAAVWSEAKLPPVQVGHSAYQMWKTWFDTQVTRAQDSMKGKALPQQHVAFEIAEENFNVLRLENIPPGCQSLKGRVWLCLMPYNLLDKRDGIM
ncbi:hypothetical protein TSUD_279050 [Trifolium subterraneum]|uniref:Reverse transcriptase zinc-binding domain-containing protein n=1 Tax=Trifolium subterraneum TaxID=3900 RepID=A0A2Z6N3N0_TRISU|nr:hypothetical protein TSUD_279050 [Trifolium subterraneum]